jgi:hypothetical protein
MIGMASDWNIDDLPDNTTHVLVPCNLRQHSRLGPFQLESQHGNGTDTCIRTRLAPALPPPTMILFGSAPSACAFDRACVCCQETSSVATSKLSTRPLERIDGIVQRVRKRELGGSLDSLLTAMRILGKTSAQSIVHTDNDSFVASSNQAILALFSLRRAHSPSCVVIGQQCSIMRSFWDSCLHREY